MSAKNEQMLAIELFSMVPYHHRAERVRCPWSLLSIDDRAPWLEMAKRVIAAVEMIKDVC